MTSCVSGAGCTIVGESARLDPKPRFEEIDLLVFDLDGHSLQQVIRFASDSGVRLVAIARDASEVVLFDAVEAGVCGFLPRSGLTPETLVSCLHAVANGSGTIPSHLLTRLLDSLAKGGGPQLLQRCPEPRCLVVPP